MEKHKIEMEKLEEAAHQIEQKPITTPPPAFEIFTTCVSISVAVMLSLYPDMFYVLDSSPANLYRNMAGLMPQTLWALIFFVACMLKAMGLLFNLKRMRIIGLIASTCLYALMAYCYALDFPSIGFIVFTYMTLFALMSIPIVKHSSIRKRKKGKL